MIRRLTRLLRLTTVGVVSIGLFACTNSSAPVVYASIDRDIAEPLLASVRPRPRVVYDAEANKTAGLVTKLLSERARPQADLFWSGEIVRTIQLADQGVLRAASRPAGSAEGRWDDPQGRWYAFAGRLRVLVVRPSLASQLEVAERSIDILTNPRWKGRTAIANPRFGTTGTHFAVLLSTWGEPRFRYWLRALAANGVAVLPGNAQVRDAVAEGEFDVGLTDTDDAISGIRSGRPLEMVVPDQAPAGGALMIPNTVALVAGRPANRDVDQLLEVILSAEFERSLLASRGALLPVRYSALWPAELPRPEAVTLMSADFIAAAAEFRRMLEIVDEEWRR